MPGTIQTFFATIDPGSPPPQQPPGFCLPAKSISPANQSTEMRPLSSGLLRWRRRVLPPGLPAVRSEFQRHRLSTRKPYAGSVAKDRHWSVRDLGRIGAGEGNRTLVCSLGSCRSTIELRPQTIDVVILFKSLGLLIPAKSLPVLATSLPSRRSYTNHPTCAKPMRQAALA
jgi:hypothetical protein